MGAYLAKNGAVFEPAPGTVLVRPDEGRVRIGSVFLTDRERAFDGFRRGEVLALGTATEDLPDLHALVRVGDVVHYDRLRPPPRQDRGVQLGRERLVLLWAEQILGVEVPA